MKGVVFNIQRFSIHDGPGIRTTVFLKGCPLRCFWCHNPEGLRPRPELEVHPDKCIGCGECVRACPDAARSLRGGRLVFDRDACSVCGRCAEACFAGALVLAGKEMTADAVIDEVLRDRAFYASSGGGVTLSGGEPTAQRPFAAELLERSKALGLDTAIQTCAHCRWDDLAALLTATDLVMADLKHTDPAKHRAATGAGNERILDNLRRLAAETRTPLVVRVPVVPAVNDSPGEIAALADFVRELALLRGADSISMHLLPFHRLAADKYASLGLEYRAAGLNAIPKRTMAELIRVARSRGAHLENTE